MKKIMITVNVAFVAYNFRYGLMKELSSQGYEVVVVGAKDSSSKDIEKNGWEFIDIPIDRKGTNILNDLKLLKAYKNIYKKEKPDIIFQFTIKPNIYGTLAAKSLKIPVVNNMTGLGEIFLKEDLIAKVVKFLYKVSFKTPKKVFFQNYDDMNLFLENGLVKKEICDRLPGSGVNLEKFYPMDKIIKNDNVLFLFIGRISDEKGVRVLYEAAKKIKNKYNNLEFQLLGKIYEDEKNAIKVEELNNWRKEGILDYLGTSKDVRQEIKNSDCIVLPSYYREGVPRTLIESAAMGKPIITTDNGGCRDIVDNGYNGFLFEPKCVDSLVEGINKFLKLNDEERAELGKNGRTKAKQEFDEKIVIEKYLKELY
ncbi:MAG: glycosyltransferase family 4 protein [Psychrilyobacter sp.]|uniref:glycosyltransferase family 4 protein n=1 Tax=Psychrilyobacter sp. TaxID=2586924 RepID=UPI003C78557C